MAVEKSWAEVGPLKLLLDGGKEGLVTIQSTAGFYVKQEILLQNTTNVLLGEVKAVLSKTQLVVGPRKTALSVTSNVTAFTVVSDSSIRAEKQSRPNIPLQELERASFAEEPIVAKRVISVDPVGNYHSDDNPSPVKIVNPGNYTSPIIYSEITAVPANVDTELASLIVTEPITKLLKIDVSGDNIATYWVVLNGKKLGKRRTYFGGNLDTTFIYSDVAEYALNPGDVLKVYVSHARPDVGNFEASIFLLVR